MLILKSSDGARRVSAESKEVSRVKAKVPGTEPARTVRIVASFKKESMGPFTESHRRRDPGEGCLVPDET